jgi:hypothetical protein
VIFWEDFRMALGAGSNFESRKFRGVGESLIGLDSEQSLSDVRTKAVLIVFIGFWGGLAWVFWYGLMLGPANGLLSLPPG